MTEIELSQLLRAEKGEDIRSSDRPSDRARTKPSKLTYAREMQCSGNDREPQYRWQYWTEHATAAITSYLAQAGKEGWVMVPLNLARRVTSIARRNEDAPEIHELSTLLTAAQNGGAPCK